MSLPKVNHPHLTAKVRTRLSAPVRCLLENHLLHGRILDFGCGLGFDTDELCRQGLDIVGYDNYYRKERPTGQFDVVLCIYVLNVLEPVPQAQAMMEVAHYLKRRGVAYFAVRRDLKEEGFRMHAVHHDWTYQTTVRLPFRSLLLTDSYELYQFHPSNSIPRKNLTPQSGRVCPFCHPSTRVEMICESATCMAFYDGYPVSPGHALIVPRRHVADYFELSLHERQAMNIMLDFVKRVVDERFHPHGYNVGINVGRAGG